MASKNNFTLRDFAIGINGGEEAGGTELQIKQEHLLWLRYTEDIQSASIKMEAMITDSQTAVCSHLKGMEPCFISFSANSDDENDTISHFMMIYDVQDRTQEDGKSKAVLLMCTPDMINNAAMKISKRYGPGSGKKIHEIVKSDLLETEIGTDKDIFFDQTENKFSFISCFWSPFTMISWLCSKSIPAEKGSGANATAGFCFYENKDGYNFRAFDSFHNQEVVTYLKVGHTPSENEDQKDKNIIPISSAQVLSQTDILKGLNIGSYASKVMTLDLNDMKYEEIPFNINKYYEDIPLLNPDSPKPAYYEKFKEGVRATRIMSKVMDTALFTSGKYTEGFTRQLSQSALREKLFYNKSVEVEFIHQDLALKVGDVVHLTTYKGKEKEEDKENSGKYIIGRLEREFLNAKDSMSTKLLLYTDSPGTS